MAFLIDYRDAVEARLVAVHVFGHPTRAAAPVDDLGDQRGRQAHGAANFSGLPENDPVDTGEEFHQMRRQLDLLIVGEPDAGVERFRQCGGDPAESILGKSAAVSVLTRQSNTPNHAA